MDKSLILAVAGAGKTTHIVNSLDSEKRFLVITYTINNTRNLKKSIIRKFGYMPENIDLFSYYNFLYRFCFRPFLGYKLKAKGIYWDLTPKFTNRLHLENLTRYLTKSRLLYHNRIAKLLDVYQVTEEINERLGKYYDSLLIDEVQDFAGHDFNLLKSICKSNLNIVLVGDFYQHTFDTSRDGNTNVNLHSNYEKYQELFKKVGVIPDTKQLDKSHRCSKSICDFISTHLGISIKSHKKSDSEVKFVTDENEIEGIFGNDEIIKLFYREHYKYNCHSRNWGDSKGENHYNDICVVLNKTSSNLYSKGKLIELKPVSKNKLYVACSRANGNLYLIEEDNLKKFKNDL